MKKKTVATAIAGMTIGAGLGMMYAPKKGSELRKDLKDKLCDLKEKVKNTDKEDIKEDFNKIIDSIDKELEELDGEKVKKLAKKKADNISKKIDKLIKAAKEKKDDIIVSSANDLKEKAILVTKDVLEKLED